MKLKLMSSFQCLMGNGVRLHGGGDSSSSSPDNNNSNSRSDHSDRPRKKEEKIKNGRSKRVIKVFKPDGRIEVYDRPIRASEVMTEDYMVCRSDSFYIGHKIPPLSHHDRLQLGYNYFLLPTHLFRSVLSFVTISSFAAAAAAAASSSSSSSLPQQLDHNNNNNNNDVIYRDRNIHVNHMTMKAVFLKKAAASSCPPFDIQKTPSGTLRIRVSEQFLSQLMMDQAAAVHQKELIQVEAPAHILCTTPQLHKEYSQLVVGSRKGWKPKLEMIKETPPPPPPPPNRNRKVKLLLSASINGMKRKINNHKKKMINKKVIVSQTSSSITTSASSDLTLSHPHQPKKIKKKKTTTTTKKNSKAVAVAVALPTQPQMTSSSKKALKSSKSKTKRF